jgi:hypothetical protein
MAPRRLHRAENRRPAARRRPRFTRFLLEELEQRVLLSTSGQRFVGQLYQDLLERPADPAGIAFWASLPDQGTPRRRHPPGPPAERRIRQPAD